MNEGTSTECGGGTGVESEKHNLRIKKSKAATFLRCSRSDTATSAGKAAPRALSRSRAYLSAKWLANWLVDDCYHTQHYFEFDPCPQLSDVNILATRRLSRPTIFLYTTRVSRHAPQCHSKIYLFLIRLFNYCWIHNIFCCSVWWRTQEKKHQVPAIRSCLPLPVTVLRASLRLVTQGLFLIEVWINHSILLMWHNWFEIKRNDRNDHCNLTWKNNHLYNKQMYIRWTRRNFNAKSINVFLCIHEGSVLSYGVHGLHSVTTVAVSIVNNNGHMAVMADRHLKLSSSFNLPIVLLSHALMQQHLRS